VLIVLGLACLVWWIGIPVALLRAFSEVTDSKTTHFLLALGGIPAAMAAFFPLLLWLNGLYLRVTGMLARLAADEEESGWHRRVHGPLEPLLVASFLIALAALIGWFFLLAEDPSRQVI
jgi:hypothetical protein